MLFQIGYYPQNVLQVLENIGFTDVFLPFVLIFTILFAVLQKIGLFGEQSRKFNAVIALAVAIGVIIPHSLGRYPPGTDIVVILNNALPNVSLLIIAIVFLLILIGLFGGKAEWGESMVGGFVTVISVALIIAIFGSAAGWWVPGGTLDFLSDPNIQATIIIIAVFWIIIALITKEEPTEGKDVYSRMGRFFGAIEKGAKEEEKKKGGG